MGDCTGYIGINRQLRNTASGRLSYAALCIVVGPMSHFPSGVISGCYCWGVSCCAHCICESYGVLIACANHCDCHWIWKHILILIVKAALYVHDFVGDTATSNCSYISVKKCNSVGINISIATWDPTIWGSTQGCCTISKGAVSCTSCNLEEICRLCSAIIKVISAVRTLGGVLIFVLKTQGLPCCWQNLRSYIDSGIARRFDQLELPATRH